MSFEIDKVTESNLEEIYELVTAAMEGDRLDQCLFPDSEDREGHKRKWTIGKYTKQIQEDVDSILLKVIDTKQKKIVGFADLKYVESSKGSKELIGQVARKSMGYEPPDGMSKELFDEVVTKFENIKPMYLSARKPHYHITMLATLPDFQGKGVGGMLLKRITEMADEGGADVYLEATPVGLRLYRKYAIEERAKLEFTGGGERICMLRRAKKQEADEANEADK